MSTEVTKMATAGSGSGFQSNTTDKGLGDETAENSISIFSTDYKKNDDLKQMLDSNKDNLKLDAMKRIIGMVAKGKDASDLFPAVVKNVVSKNMEVKKLVYVYLMRYAEEQQDLALLSISTFQRALKDPNPLIRASALRILSSIRVPIIVTIMLLAIKEAVSDMSPYVRKTAANSCCKLYSLDPEQKDELVDIIEKLLADKTILVAGSAIHAFEDVCPERIDLVHKNFRKLCNLLVDVDEWGQVVILNMLTRYGRTQFTDPNLNVISQDDTMVNESQSNNDLDDDNKAYIMDPDHRLLLRSTRPLLQSRNSSVVMAVAQLYYYLAPKSEVQIVAKALIRLLRSYREVQIVVLKNIVTITQNNKKIFDPYLKSFYVHSNDSIHIKLLKLEILTCLASESNISTILREFQAYVLSNDKEFAAATIHAIGRCASSISEVTDACLNGLVSLMSKKDETIVAESVVVIKRLLQLNPAKNSEIIKHMAKMTNKISIPMARASILWLIGEYSDHVPKIAPDVLRQMAKTFCDEEDIVKLQIINLAVKLYVSNQKQTQLLVQYVLNLAKYDQNYDIRDRARFLKALTMNTENCPNLVKHSKKFLLATKPAPVLESTFKESDQLQLGTLSHAINLRISGYTELPDFPAVAPDPTVRNVEIPQPEVKSNATNAATTSGRHKSAATKKVNKESKFYSDDEEEKSQSTEGPDPSNDEESSNSESSSEESDEEEEEEDEDSEEETLKKSTEVKQDSTSEDSEEDSSSDEDSESDSEEEQQQKKKQQNHVVQPQSVKPKQSPAKKTVATSESSDSDSDSSDESSDENEKKVTKNKENVKPKQAQTINKQTKPTKKPDQQVSLLDLDFNEPSTASTTIPQQPVNKYIDFLSPSLASDLKGLSDAKQTIISTEIYKPKKQYELLSKINGNGLQVQYQFTRTTNASSNKMTNVEIIFNNFTSYDINSIKMLNKKLALGMTMTDFNSMKLFKGECKTQVIGIDFNDTTQQAQFEFEVEYSDTNEKKKYNNLSISSPCGELLQPSFMSENEFNNIQLKLKGMNEVSATVDISYANYMANMHNNKVLEIANLCQVSSSSQETFKFASLTSSSKAPLLLTIKLKNDQNTKYSCYIVINCEKIVLANMFLKEIKELITASLS